MQPISLLEHESFFHYLKKKHDFHVVLYSIFMYNLLKKNLIELGIFFYNYVSLFQ